MSKQSLSFCHFVKYVLTSEWANLTPEQEKYLIQMRGPHDIFQFIVRDLAFVTNISNAAILYDDTFGKSPLPVTSFNCLFSHDPPLQEPAAQHAREAPHQQAGPRLERPQGADPEDAGP